MVHSGSLKYSVCNGIKMMGGYGVTSGPPHYAEKTYSGLATHNQVFLYFEMMEGDSWDDEKLYFSIDGISYLVYNFKATASPSYCGSSAQDFLYYWAFKFPHSGTSLTLKFYSDQDEVPTEESWGIRSIRLFFYNCGGSGCYSCSSSGTWSYSCYQSLFQLCPDGTVDDGSGSCLYCHSSCETCFKQASTGCSSCTSTYLYVASSGVTQTCVDPCPNGFYKNDGPPRVCSTCHTTCTTCSGGLFNNCLTCAKPSYLYFYSNECRNVCPDGTYPDGSKICQNCNLRCSKCTSSTFTTCSACNNGYYLKSTTCYDSAGCMTNNGWPNDTGNECSSCNSRCLTCTGANSNQCTGCDQTTIYKFLLSNQCLTACSTGTYPDGSNICQTCNTRCTKCTASGFTNCQQCASGFYLKSTTCYDSSGCLGSNGWPNSSTNTCDGCHSDCLSCTGPNSNQCSSCNQLTSLKYLYNSGCGTACPDGTYPDGSNVCQTCNSRCTKCTASGFTSCQQCSSGYFLKTTTCHDSAGCLSTNGWPNGATNTCDSCSTTCLSCTGPNSNQCTACNQATANKYFTSNECRTVCPDGTYPDGANICQTCDARCTKCASAGYTNCQSCSNGFYLKTSNCYNALECQDSPGWPNSSGNLCENCHSTCLTCSGPNSNQCRTCSIASNRFHQYPTVGVDGLCHLSCTSGPHVFSHEPTRRCHTICPIPTWGIASSSSCEDYCSAVNFYKEESQRICSPCHSNCATCSGPLDTECLSCSGVRYLYGSQCLLNCGTGKYGSSSDNKCKDCTSPCKDCTTPDQPTVCTSCGINKFLKAGQCIDNCLTNQYKDYDDQTCKDCHSDCLTCFGPGNNKCSSCADPKFHDEDSNQCVTNCLSPKYAYNDGAGTRKCFKTCLGLYYGNNSTRTCDLTCSVGAGAQYKDDSDNICKLCFANCATCSGFDEKNCLSCSGSRFLTKENKCELTCEEGYYAKTLDNKCYPCTSPCKTCESPNQPTKCLSCITGKFLQNNLCVDSCDAGSFGDPQTNTCGSSCSLVNYYPETSSKLCKPCDSSCKSCSGSGSKACTACEAPKYLLQGECVTSCEKGLFPDSVSRTCSLCHISCAQCSGPLSTNCISCSNQSFLYNNECLSACPLASLLPYGDIFTRTCESKCAKGKYPDEAEKLCRLCDSKCSECVGAGSSNCLACNAVFLITKKISLCSEKCQEGYYQSSATLCEGIKKNSSKEKYINCL